jgi:hypothetical protein
MKLRYEARVIDEDNDELVAEVSGYSEESMEEETGKSKWRKVIRDYEEQNKAEFSTLREMNW